LIAGSSATPHARPAVRQLAFYDRSGTAVHKVFAVDESRSEAWTRSHAAMRTTSSRRASGCRRHASPRVRPDAAIDGAHLRTGWAALKGTPGIDALLDLASARRGCRGCDSWPPLGGTHPRDHARPLLRQGSHRRHAADGHRGQSGAPSPTAGHPARVLRRDGG
jgi:hypothetical protein